MPGIGPYRDNYYQALRASNVYTRVRARLTANTPATVWDPGSGYKFVLKGFQLSITCATTTNGAEAAGNMLALVDNNANAPIITLATLMTNTIQAGSHWPGGWVNATIIAANTSQQAIGSFIRGDLNEGFKSATAANVLKFALVDGAATAASVNCSAGVFILNGVVWGNLSTS